MWDELSTSQKTAGIFFVLTKLSGIAATILVLAMPLRPSFKPAAQLTLTATIVFLVLTFVFALISTKKKKRCCSCEHCG